MKEKLQSALGGFGLIIWYVISTIIYIIPFVMIGASFWLNIVFFGIIQLFPPASIVFWIWGLICAINGVQDIWAIVYYVLFVIGFMPFFIWIISSLFSKK